MPREEWLQYCRDTERFRYLKGVTIYRIPYRTRSATWTHDHCEFCWQTLSEDEPGAQRLGYATEDRYYWICQDGARLFRDTYQWNLEEEPE